MVLWHSPYKIHEKKNGKNYFVDIYVFLSCVFMHFPNFSQNICTSFLTFVLFFTCLIQSSILSIYLGGYLFTLALCICPDQFQRNTHWGTLTLTFSSSPSKEGWGLLESQIWTQSMNFLPCTRLSLNSQFHSSHILSWIIVLNSIPFPFWILSSFAAESLS